MFLNMTRSGDGVLLLVLVLSFAWADERARLRDERERRWNTPPELTSRSVVKTPGEPWSHPLSLIPVTATISLNAGHDNNAHSVSLGAGLDGISLSGSNTYNRPGSHDGSSISASNSATFSAGPSGISTAGAEAYGNGNDAKTESHSFSLGQATATSFGTVENGQAVSGAASSVGTSQSFAASGSNLGESFSQAGAGARYPSQPTWNNVGPSDQRNDRRFGRPSFTVLRPHDRVHPMTLDIDARDIPGQRPTIRVYKWRPDRRIFPRPGLSIEHRELRPHESWSVDETRGSTGLRIGASSASSSYGFSAGDASPLSLASSSGGQVYASGYAHSHARSFASSAHRGVDSDVSADHVPDSTFGTGRSDAGASTSGHRGGNPATTRVNAQQAAANGRARGTVSSEAESLIGFPEDGSRTVPLQYAGSASAYEMERSDGDVLSDLARAVDDLFDIA